MAQEEEQLYQMRKGIRKKECYQMRKSLQGMLLAAVAQLLSAVLQKLMALCAGYGLMSLSRILPPVGCELNLALNYFYGCTSL